MADALEFILKVKDEASAALKAAGGAIKGLGQATGEAAQQAARHAKEQVGLAKSTDAAASAIRNLAIAMGGLYAAQRAISAAGDYDRTMTQIQALTGQSVEQTKAWRDEMLATSAQFGKTPQEMAEGLYFIASSGIQASDAMEVLNATAMASAAGLGETQVIANAVTSAINAYGAANLSAGDAIGQMIEGVKLGKIEAAELSAVIGQVIPNAAAAGVEFHEVNAALAVMSLSGIDAARGATMMRQTLQDVIAPSEQATKMLAAVGLSAQEMQRVFREEGYLRGLELLREKLGTGLEFRKVINDAEALTGMLALTGSNAEKATMVFNALSEATEGNLTEAFRIAAESGAFKLDQGMALLNAGMIALGNEAMPYVISGVNMLLEVWGSFMSGTVEAQNNLLLLEYAFKAVAAAVVVWVAAMAAIKLQSFLSLIGQATLSLYGMATGFAASGTAAIISAEAMQVFKAALISTGIGAIVVAIGTLIAALLYFGESSYEVSDRIVSGWDIIAATWDGAVAFTKSIWEQISGAVVVAGRVILGVATLGMSGVAIALYNNWDSIYATLKSFWDTYGEYIKIAVRVIFAVTTGGVSELAIALYNNWDSIYNTVVDVWNKIKDYIIYAVRTAVAIATFGLSELAIWAWNKGSEIIGNARDQAGKAYDRSIQGRGKPVAPPQGAQPPKSPAPHKPPKPAGVPTGSPQAVGTGSGSKKKSDYETAQDAQQGRLTDVRAEITLEQQLATVLVTSARARAQQTEEMKAYASEVARIQKLRDEGKITAQQQQELIRGAREYARAKGELAAVKYDTDETVKNNQAAESLRILTQQTEQYIAAAGLDKREREVRIAYLDAETAALQRGASAQQARIEAENAANIKRQAQTRDIMTTQADMFRNLEEEAALNEEIAKARQLGGDAAEIQIVYVKALAEAHKAGIPAAEEYARAQAEAARRQIELARVPESAQAGMARWMKDMADNAVSMGDIVYGSMGKLYDGLSDAMSSFVMGQKVAWGDLARSVIGYIAQMIAKMIVMKIVMAGLKLFGFATGGTPGTDSGMDSGVTSMVDTGARYGARGFAVHKFANGGGFTNSIVKQATAFMFRRDGMKQLGVMGEAGPEAIMPMMDNGKAVIGYINGKAVPLPLTRGPGGKLGVALGGGSSAANMAGELRRFAVGGVFNGGRSGPNPSMPSGPASGIGTANITVNVNVENGKTETQGDTKNLSELGKMIGAAVRNEIVQQQRPGGLLART